MASSKVTRSATRHPPSFPEEAEHGCERCASILLVHLEKSIIGGSSTRGTQSFSLLITQDPPTEHRQYRQSQSRSESPQKCGHRPDGILDNDSPTNKTRLFNSSDGASSHNGGVHCGDKVKKRLTKRSRKRSHFCPLQSNFPIFRQSRPFEPSGTKNGTQNIAFKRTTYLRAATCDNAVVDSTAESFATTRDTSGSSIDPNAAPDFIDTGLPAAGAAQITVRATDGGHTCYHGWPGSSSSSATSLLHVPGAHQETAKAIFRLPNRKDPESDGIPTVAIKQLSRKAMVAVTKLFNRILRTGHCHPEGGQRTPTRQQFVFHWTLNNALAGTSSALHGRRAQSGSPHRTNLFDFEKAFDRAWRIVAQITSEHPDPACARTESSFVPEVRDFFAAVEAISNRRPMRAGVPQGSCPSPSLYAVFTDDFPKLAGQLSNWEERRGRIMHDDSDYLASPCRADSVAASKGPRPTVRLDGQMPSRSKRDEDGRLIDRPTAYHATEAETRGLKWNGKPGCHISAHRLIAPCMAAQVEHVTHLSRAARIMLCLVLRSHLPPESYSIRTTSVHGLRTQHQHSTYFVPYHIEEDLSPAEHRPTDDRGSRTDILNDEIAHDLCIETIEEFSILLGGCMTSQVRTP
ncbi:hypothetical protein EVAR_76112_1 [Eumeta japonica]|uniref:Uncharacterized protein n=1 Tax=Eumeta variegata TaxID=151549 RepID=A0A4C1W6L3_EUMVA|nr:hypothetical protein EVAR_76112_1 [Eumeta japonica]